MTLRHAITPAYLVLCLLLGGASAGGFVANLILQLVALPIIGFAIWTLATNPPTNMRRAPLIMVAAIVLLGMIQLIPLPPSIWTALPGRDAVAHGFQLLNMPLPFKNQKSIIKNQEPRIKNQKLKI